VPGISLKHSRLAVTVRIERSLESLNPENVVRLEGDKTACFRVGRGTVDVFNQVAEVDNGHVRRHAVDVSRCEKSVIGDIGSGFGGLSF
jgi:3'-phosphoadenosine 5'-phosphosulfate sulfotransferase